MIVVTGATGQLGRLIVAHLLKLVPADQIAAVVRDPAKAADLAAAGVRIRTADYSERTTLAAAFSPGDKVLLISGNDLGSNVANHTAVIEAAKAANVALLAYTSILGGDATKFPIADVHNTTEKFIRASGLPFVFLRNGWYTENYTGQLVGILAGGAVLGNAGPDDRIATATRADYAAAAAAVLSGEGHENKIYELSGDTAWTLGSFAAEVATQSGKPVVYRQLTAEEYHGVLTGMGLPEPMADVFTATDDSIARGELALTTGDLRRLIGRPTTPMSETVRVALAAAS